MSDRQRQYLDRLMRQAGITDPNVIAFAHEEEHPSELITNLKRDPEGTKQYLTHWAGVWSKWNSDVPAEWPEGPPDWKEEGMREVALERDMERETASYYRRIWGEP